MAEATSSCAVERDGEDDDFAFGSQLLDALGIVAGRRNRVPAFSSPRARALPTWPSPMIEILISFFPAGSFEKNYARALWFARSATARLAIPLARSWRGR
jgi:hypothetical protein